MRRWTGWSTCERGLFVTWLPECRFAVAPRFHLSIDWADRLLLGTGDRVPTEAELALLVRDPATGAEERNLWLFELPRHLRQAFWVVVDSAGQGRGPEQFDACAAEVASFLA